MKIKIITIFLLSHFMFLLSFAQVAKKTVVEHFTNTNCSICASRNPGFYTNLNAQTNVLHLAIHPSAPYSNCLLYQQNATANDARTNYYNIYGSTPRLVINGNVIPSSANYSSSSIFTPYLLLTSPASIRIVQEKFNLDSIRATIIIKTESANSLGNLSLFVALAEDTVFYTGGNGEPQHYDVFRKSLSTTTGMSVTLPVTVGDSVVFTYSAPSNSIWNFSRIYTLAILQETASKNLVQAERTAVTDGAIFTGIAENNVVRENLFSVVNPVSKNVLIHFTKPSENYTLKIVNIIGKTIYHEQIKNTTDKIIDAKKFNSGIYFIQVENNYSTETKKIIIDK